jgi:hypothetical protein
MASFGEVELYHSHSSGSHLNPTRKQPSELSFIERHSLDSQSGVRLERSRSTSFRSKA